MYARKTLTATVTAAALILVTPAAQAAQLDRFDRSAFDRSPTITGSGYAMSGPTAGELGGHLSLSVQASDGTLPSQGQCEEADVEAVLTVSPGEVFSISTTGELCSHVTDGTPTLSAFFGRKDVEYAGTRKRARVSDGIIGFRHSFLGAQGSVGLSVRW
jgi:hypothetical protein